MLFKRVLIFGAGAVGGYFGFLLSKNGVDTTFISRGKNLDAMCQRGLTLKNTEGDTDNIKIRAVESPEGNYDLIIIAVKSKDTDVACQVIKNHLAHDGVLLSLQNGVDNIPVIEGHFPKSQIIAGVVFAALSVTSPAVITHRGVGKITVGAISSEGKKFELPLYEMFNTAGIPTNISADITTDMWKKLVWNITYNPLSALLYATCGELINDKHSRRIMEKMADEVIAAAQANGITLPEHITENTFDLRPDLYNYKTSALQDVEANRTPELEGLLGRIVADNMAGKISAPFTETVYDMLKFRHDRWFHYFPRLAADVLVVNNDKVLLIERKFPPFGWAIPGGMVNYKETVENAAARELLEETSIDIHPDALLLLGIYSNPERDPRGHTVTAVYIANSNQLPVAADDAKNAAYFHFEELPELAFDHAKVIEDYKNRYYKSS